MHKSESNPQEGQNTPLAETLTSRLLVGALLAAQVLTAIALCTGQPVALALLLACSVLSINRCVCLILVRSTREVSG
jgi:hypothetical protein